jgi:hypothetical protein
VIAYEHDNVLVYYCDDVVWLGVTRHYATRHSNIRYNPTHCDGDVYGDCCMVECTCN